MDLARIRKAIVAGVGATIAAIIPALINGDKPATPEGWGALIGGALALGLAAGWAAWRIPNKGTAGDPEVDLGTIASHRPTGSSDSVTRSGESAVIWPDDGGTDGRGADRIR